MRAEYTQLESPPTEAAAHHWYSATTPGSVLCPSSACCWQLFKSFARPGHRFGVADLGFFWLRGKRVCDGCLEAVLVGPFGRAANGCCRTVNLLHCPHSVVLCVCAGVWAGGRVEPAGTGGTERVEWTSIATVCTLWRGGRSCGFCRGEYIRDGKFSSRCRSKVVANIRPAGLRGLVYIAHNTRLQRVLARARLIAHPTLFTVQVHPVYHQQAV